LVVVVAYNVFIHKNCGYLCGYVLAKSEKVRFYSANANCTKNHQKILKLIYFNKLYCKIIVIYEKMV